MSSPDAMADVSERLSALLRQEIGYQCCDYLNQPPQEDASDETSDKGSERNLTELGTSSSSGQSEILSTWREKICKWTYEVVDHFDFNREIVSISLSYLDRFLSTRQVNHKTFQLAAMTTLFLAIKLYEPRSLKISSLIELSRGYFRAEHIVAMEKFILRDLSWKMHPPTPQCMARHFFFFPPFNDSNLDIKLKQEIVDLSHFFMELSVCDYYFVTQKSSSIALASIFNTFEVLAPSFPRSQSTFAALKREFIRHVDVHLPELQLDSNKEIKDCCFRLKDMYRQAVHSQHSIDDDVHEERMEELSPTSVSTSFVADEAPECLPGNSRKTSKTVAGSSPSCGHKRKPR